MDDSQQNGMNPQPATDGTQSVSSVQDMGGMQPNINPVQQVSSLGDLAGMTPPPAPIQANPAPMQSDNMPMAMGMPQPAPVAPDPAPVMPDMSMSAQSQPMQQGDFSLGMSGQSMANPLSAPGASQPETDNEYAYAEDLLDEILDSLDRIEAKLEAIEKKVGV